MILPDANLLLYACDASSPFHAKASKWWVDRLSETEEIGLCAPVLFAFIRISTSPRVFLHPLTIQEASAHAREWLRQPPVRWIEMQPVDVERALNLLSEAGTAGNLTSDAQIAALALRFGARVHTADADFGRFPGLRWVNPLKE